MIRNYFLTAIRNILRQRGFSLINILGLTIGLSVSFLILFYIFDELSFDKFHKDPGHLYRLVVKGTLGEMNLQTAVTPKALAGKLSREVPDVELSTVFDLETSSFLLAIGDKKVYERDFLYADTSFLKIFNFPLVYGDPVSSLTRPYSIILSENFAKKHFGSTDPCGQMIRINEQRDYEVTGVFSELPTESHISFNFLISMESRIRDSGAEMMENWENLNS